MGYSALAVANFFIEKGLSEHVTDMTPMKIQKLVYLAHGWALALYDKDILGGEDVQAWDHGPVIPSLYHSLKHYKSSPVTDLIEEDFGAISEDGTVQAPEACKIPTSDTELRSLLDALWNVFKDYSPSALRDLTHRHNTPWKMHYETGKKGIVIPKETIMAFYKVLNEQVS